MKKSLDGNNGANIHCLGKYGKIVLNYAKNDWCVQKMCELKTHTHGGEIYLLARGLHGAQSTSSVIRYKIISYLKYLVARCGSPIYLFYLPLEF